MFRCRGPSSIHMAWYTMWIALGQEWVAAERKKDKAALAERATASVKKDKGPQAWSNAKEAKRESWVEAATKAIVKAEPFVVRFEMVPPALMVLHDLRRVFRSQKDTMRLKLKDAEAGADRQEGAHEEGACEGLEASAHLPHPRSSHPSRPSGQPLLF